MNKEIEKLKEKKHRNEAKSRQVSHEIKALEAEEKSLLRKQRNHRIFTRGGMLEAFLQEPLLLTDDQVYSLLKVIFHRPEVDQILKQMSVQSMIGILSSFDAIYDRMNAAERRDLVKYLISEVELFPREEQKTQKRFVKAIAYKFPIEQKVLTQFDECGASVETVALLNRLSE